MVAVAVQCEAGRSDSWLCSVTMRAGGLVISSHDVRVAASDLQRLAPDSAEPTALVKASFEFLLERESPSMILRSFDLLDIARYFPEYEKTIRHEVRAS